ncbi:MAG TPA: class II fumarate hydratase [Alphaproteobacteria bacterium]|nr:class II fumarate hydratase [Alphaproteobacteria bacterium]
MNEPTRTETDSMGPIDVPADKLWGAVTERARRNFRIGVERMPEELIRAFGLQKLAAAKANVTLGALDARLGEAIGRAARELADGKLSDHFPLPVWQTGSGTQTNMNVNEVLANRANQILGAPLGAKSPVHPNDHVNLGQSSNDSVPTAIHIAAAVAIRERLLPALHRLSDSLDGKAHAFERIVKVGRTHLMDAVPTTLGREFAVWSKQVALGIGRVSRAEEALFRLAQGGTAVGTGLNAAAGFAERFAAEAAALTNVPFHASAEPAEGIAAHDALVEVSGALNVLAASLMKVANDVRLLASGPRAGLAEIVLPANEPGSSIMPGKVNPTQTEALTQVCVQTMANHVAITFADSQGYLELNTYKPLLAHALLQSIRLLADASESFAANCVEGIAADEARMAELLARSLMLVTALAPHIGYDKAAAIAHTAHHDGLTLKEAAVKSGLVSAADFDRWVDPAKMLSPGEAKSGG